MQPISRYSTVLLKKPDGRSLTLYGIEPIDLKTQAGEPPTAPSPSSIPHDPQPQLRWHPLRGEWVIYAAHRQNRTFLPPAHYNPLAPSLNPEFPTEMPQGKYDIAVFDNLFPSLALGSKPEKKASYLDQQPAIGHCEVIVYTQNPEHTLVQLPLAQVKLLIEVWADRTETIKQQKKIQSVLIFENRGVEVGVTLPHAHGQLYAYNHVPPIFLTEWNNQKAFLENNSKGLLEWMIESEQKEAKRILFENDSAIAFVPACARYAYEVWVLPKRPVRFLAELNETETTELADCLRRVVQKYDALFNKTFPYVMALRQAPFQAKSGQEFHLHFEFYPPLRTPQKLKFLAGTELGAGSFASDTLPEEKAKELTQIKSN